MDRVPRFTRSGLDFGVWGELKKAFKENRVEPVYVDASMSDLLKDSTDAEAERSLMDDLDELDDLEDQPEPESEDDESPCLSNVTGSEESKPSRKRAKKQRYRLNKKARMDAQRPEEAPRVNPRLASRILEASEPVYTDAAATEFPTTAHGYTAKRVRVERREEELDGQDLEDAGLRRIEYLPGKLRPLIDRNNLVVTVVADQPRDAQPRKGLTYSESCLGAFDTMYDASTHLKTSTHTRGHFCASNHGILMGQGQTEPTPTAIKTATLGRIVHTLVGHEGFIRMAKYASDSFQVWAPRLHHHLQTASNNLFSQREHLKPNFKGSLFPMCCFNMGRRVRCWKHRDIMNVPYGWCAITALGRFDHTRSGFLVLWELGVFIEFPHACTVYVPSASVTHSNSIIVDPETEQRGSFTQYFPGAILRWLDNGCTTDRELKARDPSRYADLAAWKKERWSKGLAMFSSWTEVQDSLKDIVAHS